MAIRAVTVTPIDGTGGCVLVQWAALSAGDTGEWAQLAHLPDKTVHGIGLSGAAFVLEGTNDPALTNITPLTDVDNLTAIDATMLTSKMAVVKQNMLSIRPRLTTGGPATIRMVCR